MHFPDRNPRKKDDKDLVKMHFPTIIFKHKSENKYKSIFPKYPAEVKDKYSKN